MFNLPSVASYFTYGWFRKIIQEVGRSFSSKEKFLQIFKCGRKLLCCFCSLIFFIKSLGKLRKSDYEKSS